MPKIEKSEQFVKAEDVITGTVFTILEEASEKDGNYGKELITRVKMVNGDDSAKARWRINDTNRDLLIDAYGNDTADWVGKTVAVVVSIGNNGKKQLLLDKAQF